VVHSIYTYKLSAKDLAYIYGVTRRTAEVKLTKIKRQLKSSRLTLSQFLEIEKLPKENIIKLVEINQKVIFVEQNHEK
jgi:hypothetical protein